MHAAHSAPLAPSPPPSAHHPQSKVLSAPVQRVRVHRLHTPPAQNARQHAATPHSTCRAAANPNPNQHTTHTHTHAPAALVTAQSFPRTHSLITQLVRAGVCGRAACTPPLPLNQPVIAAPCLCVSLRLPLLLLLLLLLAASKQRSRQAAASVACADNDAARAPMHACASRATPGPHVLCGAAPATGAARQPGAAHNTPPNAGAGRRAMAAAHSSNANSRCLFSYTPYCRPAVLTTHKEQLPAIMAVHGGQRRQQAATACSGSCCCCTRHAQHPLLLLRPSLLPRPPPPIGSSAVWGAHAAPLTNWQDAGYTRGRIDCTSENDTLSSGAKNSAATPHEARPLCAAAWLCVACTHCRLRVVAGPAQALPAHACMHTEARSPLHKNRGPKVCRAPAHAHQHAHTRTHTADACTVATPAPERQQQGRVLSLGSPTHRGAHARRARTIPLSPGNTPSTHAHTGWSTHTRTLDCLGSQAAAWACRHT
jgi:hypothetical protein